MIARAATIFLLLIVNMAPISAYADQDNDIKQLQDKIEKIYEIVLKQEKRLTELEDLLNLNSASSSQLNESENGDSKGLKVLWHDPARWEKVRYGMTRQQVAILLGKPTSIIGSGASEKYVYEGVVEGSGFVKGTIWFIENRVVIGAGIAKPVFLKE